MLDSPTMVKGKNLAHSVCSIECQVRITSPLLSTIKYVKDLEKSLNPIYLNRTYKKTSHTA